jgi:ribonucleoside-diphosphate reductase alpha chain
MLKNSVISIDISKDKKFDMLGLRRLNDAYLKPGETSPQERFSFIARTFGSNESHARRLYDYLSDHWLSASTPILSYGLTKKGLPISCYLSYIPDTSEGLLDSLEEVCALSMYGGGVGLGVGIRAEDDKSVGVMPHMKVYEAASLAYRQGKTRRGTFAAYLDINHPNIVPHIEMRKETGDHNMRCQELHHAVNIPDSFMELIEQAMVDENFDDSWPLIDPHSKEVREVVRARDLWALLLQTRMETGEPFIHFIDESNRQLPQFLKDKGLKITQSNICTEIILPTNAERTAVCCISSLNLDYWDEWKDSYQFYKDVAEMLDNALSMFIKKASKRVKRAILSAKQERSIGIGALGFHSLLQSKGIPFESALASSLNMQIFSKYEKYLNIANKELANERGEAPDAAGTGYRFSHLVAIAPNATSSIIMGNTSPSIEPFRTNGYRQDTLSGFAINKNKHLDKILRSRLSDTEYEKTWHSIVVNRGSCQHIDCLDDWEKSIFKTASELDQLWLVEHAAERQRYIDQAQSLNLFFRPDVDTKYLHHVHFRAWKAKLKTLYYCRSERLFAGNAVSKTSTRFNYKLKDLEEGCLSCE